MNANWPELLLTLDMTGYFTGEVHRGLFSDASSGLAASGNFVHFGPQARTNWHTHAGDQILMVVSGVILVQFAGHQALLLEPGQAIRIPDGIRHWHGSAGAPSAHIAVNLGGTNWQDAVKELEYDAALKGSTQPSSQT
jgi:quercetin dioxygenase-like cupin family protein